MNLPTEVSESVKRRNPGLYPDIKKAIKSVADMHDKMRARDGASLYLVIHGQVSGGKNSMGVTQTGRHYAKAPFKRWREAAMAEIASQLPKRFEPFSTETLVTMGYYAGDKRRRDEPAIKDAVWHVLERAGVVHDDCLLWTTHSWRNYDKQNPRVELWLKGATR